VKSIESSLQRAVDEDDLNPLTAKSILNNMKKEINEYTYLDF